MNTLDWNKLENFIQERNPTEVSAGLLDDWFWTAANVWENGAWKDRDAAYVTSDWATPGFKATMPNGDVIEVVASRDETPNEAAMRKRKTEESRKALSALVEEWAAKRVN